MRRTRRTSWLPISSAVRSSSVVVTSPPEAACVRHARACSQQVCPTWTHCGRQGQAEISPAATRPAGVSRATALPTGFTTSPAAIRRCATPESAHRTPSTTSSGSQPARSSHRPAATARSTARSRPQICDGSSPDIASPQRLSCGSTAALIHLRCGDTRCPGGSPATQRAFTLQTMPTNGRTLLRPQRRHHWALSCGAAPHRRWAAPTMGRS
jgi:hypothetical protein